MPTPAGAPRTKGVFDQHDTRMSSRDYAEAFVTPDIWRKFECIEEVIKFAGIAGFCQARVRTITVNAAKTMFDVCLLGDEVAIADFV